MYLHTSEQTQRQAYRRLGHGPVGPGPVKDLMCSDGDLRKPSHLLRRTVPLTKESLRQHVAA